MPRPVRHCVSLLVVAIAATGCGGSNATKTVTVTVSGTLPHSTPASTTANAASTATKKHTITHKHATVRLLGSPVLIHTSQRYYLAAVRLHNTTGEMKTVTVQFDALRGSRVLDSTTDVRTIQPGESLAVSQLQLPAGKRRVRASVSVEDSLGLGDDLVRATRIVGKARFTRGSYGDCEMSVQIKNRSAKSLALVGIYFVALRRGKIVSAGFDFPNVNPHLSALSKAVFVPCAPKVDVVRAYVEG